VSPRVHSPSIFSHGRPGQGKGRMGTRLRVGVAVLGLAGAAWAPATARADVITFAGVQRLILLGNPASREGAFAYDALAGELLGSANRGNAAPDIEGFPAFSGGILDIVRGDIPGGLFTFQAAQVAEFHWPGPGPVFFSGYRNGVLQGADTF